MQMLQIKPGFAWQFNHTGKPLTGRKPPLGILLNLACTLPLHFNIISDRWLLLLHIIATQWQLGKLRYNLFKFKLIYMATHLTNA